MRGAWALPFAGAEDYRFVGNINVLQEAFKIRRATWDASRSPLFGACGPKRKRRGRAADQY